MAVLEHREQPHKPRDVLREGQLVRLAFEAVRQLAPAVIEAQLQSTGVRDLGEATNLLHL
jgi:hypothetical protein